MSFYLICEICNGTFKDPRILPCFHTFCCSCLESRFVDTRKKNIKQELICPRCGLTFDLCHEDVGDLKENYYISKWISLESSLTSPTETEFIFYDESASQTSDLFLSKIINEIKWTLETINEVDACFSDLEHNIKKEIVRIDKYAQELGDERNKKELLCEIDAYRKEKEEIVDTMRVNLYVYLFGLQHHEEKIKYCVNGEERKLRSTICDLNNFLCLSLSLKDFSMTKSLKTFKFVKYPSNSYILGMLCCNKDDGEIVSHIDPSKESRIVSAVQFGKKLRTAAYCNMRSELFLLFPSCNEILVFKEIPSASDSLTSSNNKLCNESCEGNDRKTDRKIVAKRLEDANDAVVCSDFIFISERSRNWLHRISILEVADIDDKYWDTKSYNNGLSVTPVDTILVACNSTKCLIEYNIDGLKLQIINLTHLKASPRHSICLPNEYYYSQNEDYGSVGSDESKDKSYNYFAVCLVGAKHEAVILNSYGEVVHKFSDRTTGELKFPVHMTLIRMDSKPSFLICDRINRRLLFVDQNLTRARQLSFVSTDVLEHKRNNFPSIPYTKSIYDVGCSSSKIYKMKCPAKTFLSNRGDVFVVDEDDSSLLRLENTLSHRNLTSLIVSQV